MEPARLPAQRWPSTACLVRNARAVTTLAEADLWRGKCHGGRDEHEYPILVCLPEKGEVSWASTQGQSGLIAAETMVSCQRSVSSFRKTAVSVGELPTGATDNSRMVLATSGSRSASATADESWAAIGVGVRGGATMANQVSETNPGSVSVTVGTSGSPGKRLFVAMPSARNLPLLI